MAIEKSKKC